MKALAITFSIMLLVFSHCLGDDQIKDVVVSAVLKPIRCEVTGTFYARENGLSSEYAINWVLADTSKIQELVLFFSNLQLRLPFPESEDIKYSYRSGSLAVTFVFADGKSVQIKVMGDRLKCEENVYLIQVKRDQLIEDHLFALLRSLSAPLEAAKR